jgi:anti-anti-sigma factor
MPISFEDRSADFRHILLSGRLDAHEIEEISQPFTALTNGEKRWVLVDLTAVTFLTSTGIRLLIVKANALRKLGGRMVLLVKNHTLVAKTLELVGIKTMVPVCNSYPDAERALLD